MKAIERRQYEMLLRLRNFGNTHRDLFQAAPVALEAFDSINAAINELTVTDLLKESASASARADRKVIAKKALMEMLTNVCQLVRVLRGRGQDVPGFALPVSRSDQALLTAGRQFAQEAAAFEKEFSGHGVGPAAIAESTATFEKAANDRGMKRADHIAAKTRIHELLGSAILDVRALDLIVNKELSGNSPLQAVWKHARRVEDPRVSRSAAESIDTAHAPAPEPAPEPIAEVPEQSTTDEAPKGATVIEMPSRTAA